MNLKIITITIVLHTTLAMQCCESTITIRPATLDDLDAVTKISHDLYQDNFKPAWQKHHGASDSTNDFINEKMIAADLAYKNFITKQTQEEENNEKLLVAELTQSHNKIIAGFCRFEKKDAQKVYVKMLSVDRAFRKQGIAKQLMLSTISTFGGITTYEFRTLKDDKFVNDLYTKYGCTNEGTSTLDPLTGNLSTDSTLPMIYFNYSYTVKK